MGDQFRGAVPLGDNGELRAKTDVISCIWHSHDLAHPPDAPECVEIIHHGKPVRAMPLATMVTWAVVNLTQMSAITEAMAEHLNEIQGIVAYLADRDDNVT